MDNGTKLGSTVLQTSRFNPKDWCDYIQEIEKCKNVILTSLYRMTEDEYMESMGDNLKHKQ